MTRRRMILQAALIVIAGVLLFAAGWFARSERFAVPEGARFVASTASEVYHAPDCIYAEKIPLRNRAWFRSIQEAEANGCRPCGHCHPETPGEDPNRAVY